MFYSEYLCFYKLMVEMSGMVFDVVLIDVVFLLVDGFLDCLWFGVDVVDFGCGSGCVVKLMV